MLSTCRDEIIQDFSGAVNRNDAANKLFDLSLE
jgi:hypothetical protein